MNSSTLRDLLVCPISGLPLIWSEETLVDRAGTQRYPIVHGVPIIVDGVKVRRRECEPSNDFVNDMVNALGAHTIEPGELKSVFRHEFEFPSLGLQIEADQFIDRVRALGAISNPFPMSPSNSSKSSLENARLSLTSQFRLSTVKPLTTFSINASLRNSGPYTLDPDTHPEFRIGAVWTDLESNRRVESDRTHLLVPIKPGGNLTMPLSATSPGEAGKYRLQFSALIEGERWLSEGGLTLDIEVSPDAKSHEQTEWPHTGVLRTYNDDHREGITVLNGWIRKHIPTQNSIVEVGGNSSPMTRGMSSTVVNVDIDPFGMIIGNIRDTKSSTGVTYLVSDAMNLPFADRSIDVFAMFATFHHFPDPVGLLRHLSKKLTHGGLIALLCEPIGHVWRSAIPDVYRDELLKGVNEQSFALWEYAQMFDAAGLYVVEAQVDLGSLKVALKTKNSE
jgi:SAM-dependent methyltransferase